VDPGLTYTVADLAPDEAIEPRCACRVRAFRAAELAAMVGPGTRLHLIGLERELWCRECGEAPLEGRASGPDRAVGRRE
jgi:hypothetical protein